MQSTLARTTVPILILVLTSCGTGRRAPHPPPPPDADPCLHPSQAIRAASVDITVDGRKRSYLLDVPEAPAGKPLPVVVAFHGLGGAPEGFREWTGIGEEAHERGFVAAHPRGKHVHIKGMTGRGWQISATDDREVRLTREIVADLESRACIDAQRIHAVGFSNGGYLVHFLACRLPDLIAGTGSVAGGLDGIGEHCGPVPAKPAVIIHGTGDAILGAQPGRDARDFWVERDGCTDEHDDGTCIHYTGCTDDSHVVFCEHAGGHTWPTSPVDATDVILDHLLMDDP